MSDLNVRIDLSEISRMDQNLQKLVKKQLPITMKQLLDSLGEVLLGEAKEVFRRTATPHNRYKIMSHRITRGVNKGKIREMIGFCSTINTNSVDTGELWNSLSHGGMKHIWNYHSGTQNLSLTVGSDVEYASFVHDGVEYRKRRWVPGIVDSNGIFRYQKGAKTGLMVHPHRREGIFYFDIAIAEIKKIAPGLTEKMLKGMFRDVGW